MIASRGKRQNEQIYCNDILKNSKDVIRYNRKNVGHAQPKSVYR